MTRSKDTKRRNSDDILDGMGIPATKNNKAIPMHPVMVEQFRKTSKMSEAERKAEDEKRAETRKRMLSR